MLLRFVLSDDLFGNATHPIACCVAMVAMAGAVDVHAALCDSQLAHPGRRQRALDVCHRIDPNLRPRRCNLMNVLETILKC